MGRHRSGPVRLAALAVLAGLALAGCGGGDIESAPTGGGGGEECGEFDIAINPWVGYEASAHVVGYVASSRLGCDVEYKNVKEEVAWQGMGNDEIDVVIENWGHDDLKGRYLPRLATRSVGAYALSEAGSGSDAFALQTRAIDAGGDLVLTGR